MTIPRARASVRLAAATCPLSFGCNCTGACPMERYRAATLPRLNNPAALGGFLDDIVSGISTGYQTVTGAIANVVSPAPTSGDFTNITFAGSKYPTSSVFTADFVNVRTQNSLQGLANDIASGLALPRDDGSVATRDNKSTLAPAGSVYASFFQSKGVQILSSAAAPQVAQPQVPGVLNSILSGISFGVLGGQDTSSPTTAVNAASPATAGVAPTTGPAWVDASFLAFATQPRLDRIIADLKAGAAVVLTDGSIGVPQANGTYAIIAPSGSVNVPLYTIQTGQATVVPKGAAGTPGAAAPTTFDALLKNIGSILTTGATTAAQVYAAQQVQKLTAPAPIVTPAQQQAQQQVAALSSQLAQAQAQLQAQQAAQASAAAQAAQTAQIQALQQQLRDAQAQAQQAALAAQAAASVTPSLVSSGLISGPVMTPAYIPPSTSVATPDLSSALAAMLGATPATPGTPAAAVQAPIAVPVSAGPNWTLIILGVAVVGGGAFFLLRRRAMGAGGGRSYRSRPVRRRRRRRLARA